MTTSEGPRWLLELRRPRFRTFVASLGMAGCCVFFANVSPEPGGLSANRLMHALGPTGRDVLAGVVGLVAAYFFVVTIAPGPALRVAPEGIWVAGLAREGIAKPTVFLVADDILDIDVEVGEIGGVKIPPFVRIRCRGELPIKVSCYSEPEGEEFVEQARLILEQEPAAPDLE